MNIVVPFFKKGIKQGWHNWGCNVGQSTSACPQCLLITSNNNIFIHMDMHGIKEGKSIYTNVQNRMIRPLPLQNLCKTKQSYFLSCPKIYLHAHHTYNIYGMHLRTCYI